MVLWIILTLMVALAVSGLTIPLVRQHDSGRARATAISVLAAQLRELEAQLAAGELSESEAVPLRTEINRRIVAEGREPAAHIRPVAARALPFVALGLAGVVALAATILYATIGRPDLVAKAPAESPTSRDAPIGAAHPGGDVSQMIAQLEARMQQTPNDAEGWRMLGWSYLAIGRSEDAAAAYARAVALDPGNAGYLSAEGDALVRAAGGAVTPAALERFRSAAKADPTDPRARYYLALHRDQSGDHDGAMADWIALIRSAPSHAPWVAEVRRFVETIAHQRGLNLAGKLATEPAGGKAASSPSVAVAPGPSDEQVQAANGMSSAERQSMIASMVDRLAAELKANPRNVEGWERLMRARMVLGETAAAAAAYRDANNAFAKAPELKTRVRDSARALGVPGA